MTSLTQGFGIFTQGSLEAQDAPFQWDLACPQLNAPDGAGAL